MKTLTKIFLALSFLCSVPAMSANTWYIRPDGGTRYSSNVTSGQCNGLYNAAYPGTGVNQNCAFSQAFYLWQDGSYATDGSSFPAWGWVIAGGDTVIVAQQGTPGSYRLGWPNANNCGPDPWQGLCGDPFGSSMPTIPSGTSGAHTRVLGANYASCAAPGAKTFLNGGYGLGTIISLNTSSYVDVACFDITDFSSCGKYGQTTSCSSSPPLSDYASNGVYWTNAATNDTLTDINIHGVAAAGMQGPTGTGVTLTRVTISGNPSSGWNLDNGDGTTGTGTLSLTNFHVLANGCAEAYPITSTITMPIEQNGTISIGAVGDCTDDNSGGYGDGFGTASTVSSPAWYVTIANSTAAYNTQDGFDALHIQGGGSTLTVKGSLAYGNMGQQIKEGQSGSVTNNVLVGNCNALRQSIPGFLSGFNTKLSDFCRAADTTVLLNVNDGSTTVFANNTLFTASAVALEINVNGICTAPSGTCNMIYENNVFYGFTNNIANGYPGGGSGANPAPVYIDSSNPFSNLGSTYSYNATYGQNSGYPCPLTADGETHAVCVSPGLVDQTWHLYGIGNMAPSSGSSAVVGAGVTANGVTTDYNGITRPNPPAIGAFEPTVAAAIGNGFWMFNPY